MESYNEAAADAASARAFAAHDGPALTDASNDKIHIADEVLNQIITMAVNRVGGVSFTNTGVGDGIAGFLGMKGASRGIRIEAGETEICVDIYISVEYGARINEIAKKLQDEIRGDLTNMTGLNVTGVNVHILAINVKDQPTAKSQKSAKQQKERESDSPSAEDPGAPNSASADAAAGASKASGAASPGSAMSGAVSPGSATSGAASPGSAMSGEAPTVRAMPAVFDPTADEPQRL